MPALAQNALRMPRQGIREIMDMAASMSDVIHVEVGEPDFSTPEHIVSAAFAAARQGFTRYTANAGFLSLREKLVQKLARLNGLPVTPDNIVVTAGGVCGIATSVLAIMEPGDEVLIPDPAWPDYELMVVLANGVPRRYALAPANGFCPDPDEIERQIGPRTKALIINTPSSPAGAVFSPALVRALVDLARCHDLFLIADEMYEQIVFEGEHVSAMSFDTDGRVIGLYGFSKAYAMTGWRIGYVVAAAELAALITRLQEPLTSCASAVSQKAAEAALDGPQDCVAAMRDSYRQRRDRVANLLSEQGVPFQLPHGTFYLLADIAAAGLDSYAFARALLLEERVAVAPGETFGPTARSYVRISLATAEADLLEAVRRLGAFVQRRSVPLLVAGVPRS